MKGIVLETRGRKAAVLMRDGTVRRVRGRYRVGQRIRVSRPGGVKRLLAAAAVLVMLVVSGALWAQDNLVAYADVALDTSASIEYTLNRNGRVIAVKARSAEAEAVVDDLNSGGILFVTLEEAMDRTLNLLGEKGCLSDGGEDHVLVTVSSDDEKARKALSDEAGRSLSKARERNDGVSYTVNAADRATAPEVRERGLSEMGIPVPGDRKEEGPEGTPADNMEPRNPAPNGAPDAPNMPERSEGGHPQPARGR